MTTVHFSYISDCVVSSVSLHLFSMNFKHQLTEEADWAH